VEAKSLHWSFWVDARSTPQIRREGRTHHSQLTSRDSGARLQVRLRHLRFADVDGRLRVSFAHQKPKISGDDAETQQVTHGTYVSRNQQAATLNLKFRVGGSQRTRGRSSKNISPQSVLSNRRR